MITREKVIRLPFTQAQAEAAYRAWGCNCGPSALAAVLGLSLDQVRPAVEAVGFAGRRYMNPTMMGDAARRLCATITPTAPFTLGGFPARGLVRIQWEGPWTEPDVNPKWRYRHTHWIATWRRDGHTAGEIVFDINGGLMLRSEWEAKIVPAITDSIPRANGEWHVTHSWEVRTSTQTGASS